MAYLEHNMATNSAESGTVEDAIDLPTDSVRRDPIVAKYLKELPDGPADFFAKMERAFREKVDVLKTKLMRAGGQVKRETGTPNLVEKLMRTEKFVEDQRAEINRLNAELGTAQSERRRPAQMVVTHSPNEVSQSVSAAVKNRDQTINSLKDQIKGLKIRLQEAMKYDVRAELDTQRLENKAMRARVGQVTSEAATALQAAQQEAQAKYDRLHNSSKALQDRNEDLQKENERIGREFRKLADEYDKLQKQAGAA